MLASSPGRAWIRKRTYATRQTGSEEGVATTQGSFFCCQLSGKPEGHLAQNIVQGSVSRRKAHSCRPTALCSGRGIFSVFSVVALCLLTLPKSSALQMMSSPLTAQVAVTGTTGRLGREAVQQLAAAGTPVRCLLRHKIEGVRVPQSISQATSSPEIAAYLASLPGVEMVQGDVTDAESVSKLLDGCTACLALHGATRRSTLVDALPWVNAEDTVPDHAKQVNYNGVKHLIAACHAEGATCKRVVRITGKGEAPWQVFTVLINMLGGMAKGWNYEGEELLRRADPPVDYTIIRPGVMGPYDPKEKALGLKDNGQDMKVTPVRHTDIANLAIASLGFPNAARATLTAMNVPEGEGEASYEPLLAKVAADTRQFPSSLIDEHKRAVTVVASVLGAVLAALAARLAALVWSLVF